ncbi:MAG: hypothetical protein H7X89_04005 [Rhizobiales bacterium]|nr:hypothetical protein [Hyphomicrobiales bacterium]
MSRILTITFAALMLAGPASSYDKSAMPKASAAMKQASLHCKARLHANELKTYSEWQDCQLTAERAFVMAVNIKMDTFDEYANGMKSLAADLDANPGTAKQIRSRASAILDTFLADCGCKPARISAGGPFLGQGQSSNSAPNNSMGFSAVPNSGHHSPLP